jgi:hypothetical protein
MTNDDEVLALFKKYLHFNSQEEANEFHRVFFEWLNALTREMVSVGVKNGYAGGFEACIKAVRQIDEEGGCSLRSLVGILEEMMKECK